MNAPSLAKWILLATPLMFSGCRTSNSVTPIGGTVEPGRDNGAGDGALLVQGQGSYDAPPHLFSPRPHPPRTRMDPPAANLSALPKLVNRIDRCYGSERPDHVATPLPRQPRPVRPRGGRGDRPDRHREPGRARRAAGRTGHEHRRDAPAARPQGAG